jgi:quinol-cytochrome oxidoreductase complex cytochrome b subunit
MRPSFILHLHPPTIPARQARFSYTLAAGGLAVFLMLVLLITGILELFYYIPTPAEAGNSIQTLAFLVPYGGLVRNLHYWSAQLFVVVTLIHLLRVIFTGGYAPPRGFNYLLGLSLFVLTILLDFTGYVLRWDEGIHWALVAGTNLIKSIPLAGNALYWIIVGGTEPGSATLIRFYGWHIFGLTLAAGILLIWHVFRLRRDGGIALPPPPLRQDKVRITRYQLFQRELLATVLASAALLLLAVFAPAPLAPPITAGSQIAETARAPWFFLWVQQLLKLGSPFLWGVVVPLAILLLLSLIPYLFPQPIKSELGRWFPKSGRLAQGVTIFILLFILALSFLSLLPAPGA